MPIYIAIIHKDPDSDFGVVFPDVPGCFSAASRLEDLQAMCTEALDLHLEEGEAPVPRSFEAVLEEVREDLAAGAFLMMVPWERKI